MCHQCTYVVTVVIKSYKNVTKQTTQNIVKCITVVTGVKYAAKFLTSLKKKKKRKEKYIKKNYEITVI